MSSSNVVGGVTSTVTGTFSALGAKSVGIGKITVGDLFSALLTLLICLVVIRLLGHILAKVLERSRLDGRVQKYVVRGLRFLGYLITIILVIESLGVDSTSLVALLSVGSLGITLAAEDILGNVAGGLVILSSRPFSIGDFIEADGVSGTVREITLNHTRLATLDGLLVMLPNKALSNARMTNYTALGRRRVERKVTASYAAPTEAVKAACRDALAATPCLLADPASSVYLSNYGASSIEYSVYCWCKPEDYWTVYFALEENLRTAFAGRQVEMTYDHLNVHIVEK